MAKITVAMKDIEHNPYEITSDMVKAALIKLEIYKRGRKDEKEISIIFTAILAMACVLSGCGGKDKKHPVRKSELSR